MYMIVCTPGIHYTGSYVESSWLGSCPASLLHMEKDSDECVFNFGSA
jgi:hypothetical protein